MTDVAEFLPARIAEDEAVARLAAGDGGWSEERHPFQPHWTADDHEPDDDGKYWPTVVRNGQFVIAGGHGGEDDGVSAHQAQHIARFDPARVLDECEAKRRIVKELATTRNVIAEIPSGAGRLAAEYGLDAILRLLTLPYADHPDYREEWRP